MKQNTTILYIASGGLLLLFIAFIFSSGRTPVQTTAPTESKRATASTSASFAATNDSQDIVPGRYPNQIKNTSTTAGLSIPSVFVENNVDSAGKITDDHLEIRLKNDSKQDMTNLETYYTVTDATTGKSEGYYKKLSDLILKPGDASAVHFDGKKIQGHFGVNKDGLYFTSKNKLQFVIDVSTPGFKIAHFEISKDAGGAEIKD